jgi:hypothetical protein
MQTAPPEAPQLRPLGVGDIVDRVFALYRNRPGIFLGLAAVPYLVLVVAIAVVALFFASTIVTFTNAMTSVAAGAAPDPAVIGPALARFGIFGLIVVVLAVVILSTQTAALVYAMGARYLGRPTNFGEAFRAGLSAAPRIIGAGLVVFLTVFLGWAVLIVIMAVSQQVLVVLGLSIAGLVGTIYFFASTLVSPVVATLERAGPVTAIRRSWQLSQGNLWRIIGLQLLLFVLNAVISVVLSAIFLSSLISDTTVRAVIQQIASIITNVAWAPVEWGTFAILYYDLRVRREAFDLQLAAEALPRQP